MSNYKKVDLLKLELQVSEAKEKSDEKERQEANYVASIVMCIVVGVPTIVGLIKLLFSVL